MEERIVRRPGFVPDDLGAILSFRGVLANLGLVASLTRREIGARHRGSWLGLCWPVLEPLLLLGVYTFVFSFVFGARWPGLYASDVIGYATVVFTGLVTFNIFAEALRSAPTLIVANRTFVTRVVFPLEVLPVVQVAAALVHALAGLAVLLAFLIISGAGVPATAVWLPAVWLLFAVFALGLCYLIATVSVFARDLEPLIGILIMGLFFGSAIFYPIERLPDGIQEIVRMVPTAAAVDLTRSLLLLGVTPTAASLIGPAAVSLGTLVFGYACFMKAKGSFADAL